ncbi:MAG: carbamoyltransferase HypF [Thermoprotei archaeon]|nr:MAG: carbamoyltransferase HypF [Thermoprotei archaeon]
MVKAFRITVSGIVQGVGFRPFIHRLALSLGLTGYVRNLGGSEVEIWIEGSEEAIRKFIERLRSEKPPSAKIEELRIEEVECRGFTEFKILRSSEEISGISMIPPDIAICRYCLEEILNPSSRWYRYPFNSCAWCGPRFSMIERVPYDRENTSMRDFPLCDECLREYSDVGNVRRYHAQGISCPKCGPKVTLLDKHGEVVDVKDPISVAARLIDEGYIIAVKGLGGYHIACLATDDDVVLRLRMRKKRTRKPFALMVLDVSVGMRLCYLTSKHVELLTSPEAPIVIAPRREDAPVSPYVAPNMSTLGIMLPYTGLHYLLLSELRDKFAIMTSGNIHGKPTIISDDVALKELGNVVDYLLVHNRRIVNRVDDSVVRLTDGEPTILRRSRGYAPTWLKLPFKLPRPVIAFGAELSSCGAIGIDRYVIPTQYVGDVDEYENLVFLEQALRFLIRNYRVDLGRSVLVSDLHPRYTSTYLARKWSEENKVPLMQVQHHHSHIVAVLVDHGIDPDEEVIGIAIDGLGYGIDGNAWGGEVLRVTYRGFRRVGHLRYQVMPGGDLAVKYPIRMLISILASKLEEDEVKKFIKELGYRNYLESLEFETILKQVKMGSPVTSSMGRVLDAISVALGICWERTYEGEPAILLEEHARGGKLLDGIRVPIHYMDDSYIIDTTELLYQVIEHAIEGYDTKSIALTAQYELGRALGDVAKRCSTRGITYVVVSGGCAVNDYIVKGIREALTSTSLKLLRARRIPPNDGSIAVGQVAIVGAELLNEN